MKITSLAARLFVIFAVLYSASARLTAQDAFGREIQPLFKRYCLGCHSASRHAGDLNLERFQSTADVLKVPKDWEKVIEQVSLAEMPPKAMPQPSPAERERLLAWARGALRQAGEARAGDPGPVVLRRLNNAEFTYTVRDLTGVQTLDPAREFPADGAAGEGFTNTGNSLVMSPSMVTKYLDAAKDIASHAVLLPDGIGFSGNTSRRDWTNESLDEIRAFYQQFTESGGAETVTQQGIALDKNRGGALPLKRYLAASLAVRAGQTVDAVARHEKLSPKYLGMLVRLLTGTAPSPLVESLRRKWRARDVEAMVAEIEEWQQTLWKFSSVGHIGKVDGPKAWMEPVTPVVAKQEFRTKLIAPPGSSEVKLFLVAEDAGDGASGDAVVWHEPRISIAGRAPVPLREVRGMVAALSKQREVIVADTAAALNAAAGLSSAAVNPVARKAWFDYLGVTKATEIKPDLLTARIEKTATFSFIQGWGGGKQPSLLVNSTGQHVRIPGNMKAHAVALIPSATHKAAVAWRSPIAAPMRIEATITPAHAECGNGVAWSLELRRGGTRLRLREGNARGAAPVRVPVLEKLSVQTGDLISIVLDPREGNASCDLTDVEFTLLGGGQEWSLTRDLTGNVLAGNPHADSAGRQDIWHIYSEPVAGAGSGTIIPAGSLLARWQGTDDPAEKRELAASLQALLTAPSPLAATPDGALYRQLTSLAGPLFIGLTVDSAAAIAPSKWGLDPSRFKGADLHATAPATIEITLPADLVADSDFTVTGALDPVAGAEGSVQLQVLATPPSPANGLRPSGTTVRTADGTWTSNNQRVTYAIPVVVNERSAARGRVEAALDEYRQMFPASLCYTKIVPVDEVVTLTLFHREDQHLGRLILTDAEKARLDRMWQHLLFVSRAPLTQVDVFEQLWQYATQDADPSKFEPLRKPINDRAAAFRQELIAAEPKQLDAVIDFADRAYRRPLAATEKTDLRALYARLRQQELPHEEALRLTLARVLVAPAFLYRTEKPVPGPRQGPVGDWEIATRLSYFLWSSQPDAELRAAAAAGKLRTVQGLAAQTRRMLADPRVRRLAGEFGTAWLHISGFDSLDEKSERHFPTFRALRGDMYEESIRFFADFFQSNRPVLSLLDADHTFVNEALARHYGIEGISGPEWRRVEGMRGRSRGGVLGLSATLAKQSGASRTSPILRGNWVAEVLLGDKLPRPPKDVPQLPEDEANLTLTMRELTEKHTSDPRCSTCHRRVDPYGYALERFDAIGRWRDKDLGGRPLHTNTKVMDGTEFDGLDGLRQYILTKGRSAFTRQFCRKLLGYALGRAVQLSDEPLLTEIQANFATGSPQVGAVIEKIVASRQFRDIRGRDAAPEE